jgi:hypothetical protein
MKEHPILFSTPMIQALLENRKMQTRRVMKPQPILSKSGSYWSWKNCSWTDLSPHCPIGTLEIPVDFCPYGQVGDRLWCKTRYGVIDDSYISDIMYGLYDDRIYGILTTEVENGRYKTIEWCPFKEDTYITQRRLHGGVGWSNLLTDKIQGLWSQGIRGMVSVKRAYEREGIFLDNTMPPKQKSNQKCPQTNMYVFSWNAPNPIFSSEAFRRESGKRFTEQSNMGNTARKLDGQKSTRERQRGGEAPNGKINRLRDESIKVGDRNRSMQPTSCSNNSWDVSGWNISSCPTGTLKWKSSIFMPRWASRITLEITDIRVERLQEITIKHDEVAKEGWPFGFKDIDTAPVNLFIKFWDSINGKKYPWDSNPWVWVISFKRV